MARESMDISGLLRKRGLNGDVNFLLEALGVVAHRLTEAEVTVKAGAECGERSADRVTERSGYRSRSWNTRVGTMELRIPKLRYGSYFPSLLETCKRSEKALLTVIQQAYVEGVSTRRVDDLVKALGCVDAEGETRRQDSQRERGGGDCRECRGQEGDRGPGREYERGLTGVELVISDAHQGLRDAIATVFAGGSRQCCCTLFMTSLLTRVPKRTQP